MENYLNPIIRGFHPDPSICRNGSEFFLVTSTFEFFPGVPLYRSENLANWTLINHCLSRDSQLPLRGCGHSSGIYAPTIRFHDGIYYMTATNVSSIRNFIVHTADPSREWSEPVLVNQTGIDPSLFFDEDGTAYYTSTAQDTNKRDCIQMCVVDPLTGEKKSESKIITHGCGGCYPEGPHIYKRNGYYYLLLAEGGTEYGHHAVMMRAASPWGPYEPSPYNPLIYHQNLQGRSPIQAVGHADLVEDANGNWWMVCLGIRRVSYALLHNLGRETFLVPVTWSSDGWPLAGDQGTIGLSMNGPLPRPARPVSQLFCDDFNSPVLNRRWTFLRNPEPGSCRMDLKSGCLSLTGSHRLSDPLCSPAFAGIRQEEYCMRAQSRITGELSCGQAAGMTAYYTNSYHYEIYLKREKDQYFIGVNKRIHDLESEVFCQPISYGGSIRLQITCDEVNYHFLYEENQDWHEAAYGLLAGLCTEGTARMTYTGTFIGLFSTGGTAHFEHFRMQNLTR